MNNSGNSSDDRLWKLECDKANNGYAVIRFLPAPDGEDLPFVKVYSHAFQGPGGWLIDNCLTTLGQNCPVCEANRELWNTGSKDNQSIVRDRKRKLSYFANIYVVKDPVNPANEGRVFLYKFGKKIFDKITAAMQPEYEDEQAIDPFDFWQGANFKMKIKNVAGYRNYDSSEFAKPEPLLDDDDALEAIWKKQYSLEEFTRPDQFKTYEELEKRMNSVLNPNASSRRVDPDTFDEEEEIVMKSRQQIKEEERVVKSSPAPAADDDDDDALSYFQRLAEE